MNIYGKKVVLRAIEERDISLIVDLFNDPEVENLVSGWSFPLSVYSQKKWMDEHFNDPLNHRFIIENEEGVAIGIVTLTDIDWRNRVAFHGMKIKAQNMRNKGYGTDSIMAIMRYAFDTLGLNRLDGSWFMENVGSRHTYMKCGWKEEGVRRKYIYKNGRYRDLVLTGILASEYYELMDNNNYWDE